MRFSDHFLVKNLPEILTHAELIKLIENDTVSATKSTRIICAEVCIRINFSLHCIGLVQNVFFKFLFLYYRDPIPYLPPPDKLPHEKKSRGYLGVGEFLANFEDPKDTPPPTKVETREERLERRRRERAEQVAYRLEREIATWDPNALTDATEDPFKTLFVARVNYDTSESKLRREFEVYGPIKKVSRMSWK